MTGLTARYRYHTERSDVSRSKRPKHRDLHGFGKELSQCDGLRLRLPDQRDGIRRHFISRTLNRITAFHLWKVSYEASVQPSIVFARPNSIYCVAVTAGLRTSNATRYSRRTVGFSGSGRAIEFHLLTERARPANSIPTQHPCRLVGEAEFRHVLVPEDARRRLGVSSLEFARALWHAIGSVRVRVRSPPGSRAIQPSTIPFSSKTPTPRRIHQSAAVQCKASLTQYPP